MSPSTALSTLALVLALAICTVTAKETEHVETSHLESANHQPQKRSAILEPEVASDDQVYMDELPYLYDDGTDADKRSSLFRFGKRGGSLFRFGKRGSLFRFGKRGSLFRFGKRGGTLFRFGRSGPADDLDEKRTLFRFGKRSNLDLVREALESGEYPTYEELSKRAPSGFHWGQEQN